MDRGPRKPLAHGSPSRHRERISQHLQNLKPYNQVPSSIEQYNSFFIFPRYEEEEEYMENEEPIDWRVKTRVRILVFLSKYKKIFV